MSQGAEIAAALVGGGLAAGTHLTKAGSRIMINTSPEPVTNWAASIGEDLAVIAGLWTALYHPWLFLALLFMFVLLMIWLLPKLWRAIRRGIAYLGNRFGRNRDNQLQLDIDLSPPGAREKALPSSEKDRLP